MYTFEQLKEDVRKEAEALRIHATKEERERLDFQYFLPDQPTANDASLISYLRGETEMLEL